MSEPSLDLRGAPRRAQRERVGAEHEVRGWVLFAEDREHRPAGLRGIADLISVPRSSRRADRVHHRVVVLDATLGAHQRAPRPVGAEAARLDARDARALVAVARVVYQHVDASEVALHLGDERGDGLRARHLQDAPVRAAFRQRLERSARLLGAHGADDLMPFRERGLGEGAPEPGADARDDDYRIARLAHGSCSSWLKTHHPCDAKQAKRTAKALRGL
ncbi:hypothetical protein WMF17_44145 [Sorangium sp. So ce362]